jgi:PTS system N-acetylglucosamine-specific IIC component
LFALHAVLTGVSFVVMSALGVKLGFGFSAGLFDYVLNFAKATRPWLLMPVGLAYFGVYYGAFRWAIARFDLKTPGREAEAMPAPAIAAGERGWAFARALGGAGNLVSVDACTTRLRLVVADQGAVDEPALRALGARGLVRPSPTTLQVVLGPIADQVAGEIRDATAAGMAAPSAPAIATAGPTGAAVDPAPWLSALGGRANLVGGGVCSTRLYLTLADPAAVDEAALRELGARAFARPAAGSLHVLIGSTAERVGRALELAD